MPQVNPMNWFMWFLFFEMMFTLMMVKFHFFFNFSNEMNLVKKSLKTNTLMLNI